MRLYHPFGFLNFYHRLKGIKLDPWPSFLQGLDCFEFYSNSEYIGTYITYTKKLPTQIFDEKIKHVCM
jgi:hypothetical protein